MSEFWDGFKEGLNSSLQSPAAGSVMMALGPIRFGVLTQEYDELRTSMSWRWAEKARYLREPALQYHGQGTITKTLNVVVIVERGSDLEFVPNMQALADTGEPQRLVAGHSRSVGGVSTLSGGSDMGLWCITALEVTESEFMRDGTAMMHKAALTIRSYGDDR